MLKTAFVVVTNLHSSSIHKHGSKSMIMLLCVCWICLLTHMQYHFNKVVKQAFLILWCLFLCSCGLVKHYKSQPKYCPNIKSTFSTVWMARSVCALPILSRMLCVCVCVCGLGEDTYPSMLLQIQLATWVCQPLVELFWPQVANNNNLCSFKALNY